MKNTKKKIKRLDIEEMGLTEVTWPNRGNFSGNDNRIINAVLNMIKW